MAYRISKPPAFDNHLALAINEESPRNNQVTPLIAYSNGIPTDKSQKTHSDTPIKDYSNGTLNIMDQDRLKSPMNTSKKSLLSNEKSSSTCTIQ